MGDGLDDFRATMKDMFGRSPMQVEEGMRRQGALPTQKQTQSDLQRTRNKTEPIRAEISRCYDLAKRLRDESLLGYEREQIINELCDTLNLTLVFLPRGN